MGFGLVLAGFILLFNPVIHVIDLIPDAIGFFLIAAGLTKLSCFIGKIEQARSLFLKLAYVELGKMVSLFLIPYGNSAAASDLGTTKLLLAFVFSLVELLLFMPALKNLFEGISFAGMMYNGSVIQEKREKKVRVLREIRASDGKTRKAVVREVRPIERYETVSASILTFYIIRLAGSILPELTELQMYDYIGEVTATSRRLTYYKPFLYVLCFLIVLIAGIVYIRRISKFFGNVRKDKIFIDSLKEKYARDILPNETYFTAKSMNLALILFGASVVASLVLPVNGVNVMVGAISSGILIAASCILAKWEKLAKGIVPISVVRAVLSVLTAQAQYAFYSEYDEVIAIDYFDNAYTLYYRMATLEVIENLLASAAVILFYILLTRAVKKQIATFGIQDESVQYNKKNRDAEIGSAVNGKVMVCLILTVVHYILEALYRYLLTASSFMIAVNMGVTLIMICYAVYALNFISEQVYQSEIHRF